jgi:hypothetical protein
MLQLPPEVHATTSRLYRDKPCLCRLDPSQVCARLVGDALYCCTAQLFEHPGFCGGDGLAVDRLLDQEVHHQHLREFLTLRFAQLPESGTAHESGTHLIQCGLG